MIIEYQEYIKMLTPFPNGCTFRLVKIDEKYYIEHGCCCYVHLLTGANHYMESLISSTNMQMLEFDHPKVIQEILAMKPCSVCGGIRIKPSRKS